MGAAEKGEVPMSAISFANKTLVCPPSNIKNCHEAVLYWLLKDEGKPQPNKLLDEIREQVNPAHLKKSSIFGEWFKHFYNVGTRLRSRVELRNSARVGDVLVVGPLRMPVHSMVVVSRRSQTVRGTQIHETSIRGFNNYGTLGTGVRDHYDDSTWNIDDDRYWNGDRFGNSRDQLYRVGYTSYRLSVLGIIDRRAQRHPVFGHWVYSPVQLRGRNW